MKPELTYKNRGVLSEFLFSFFGTMLNPKYRLLSLFTFCSFFGFDALRYFRSTAFFPKADNSHM